MIRIKTTLVLSCTHSDCDYGIGSPHTTATIDVPGMAIIVPETEVDAVPSSQTIVSYEFDLPDGWQANYNKTDFRCPEHHEQAWK